MSFTAAKMIDEVKGNLQGYSLDEEQSTTLADVVGTADLSFTVTEARGVAIGASPGIMEIDLELLYASDVADDGTVTIVPWGRGYLSTTAAEHTVNSRVISQPMFPKQVVLNAINDTLNRVFPKVFAVKVVERTATFPVRTYGVPTDCERVLDVRWSVPDASKTWRGVRRWRYFAGGGTQDGDTSPSIDIYDPMIPGRTVVIEYAAKPAPLVNLTDIFETATGLPASMKDVITLGAAVQLLPSQELSRLQMSSVEQQDRAQLVPPSAGLVASGRLEEKFQTRLAEEAKSLRDKYPPRYTGPWV